MSPKENHNQRDEPGEAFAPLQAWWMMHRLAAKEALLALLRGRDVGWGVLLQLALAWLLPLLLAACWLNWKAVNAGLLGDDEIAVFLKPASSEAQAREFGERLQSDPRVAALVFESREAVLRQMGKDPATAHALSALAENPFSDTWFVRSKSEAAQLDLLRSLQEDKQVAHVRYDGLAAKRMHQGARSLQALLGALAVLVALGNLLAIAHSLRAVVQQRAEEIHVARLHGATRAFVRRPFLWLGALLGATSAVIGVLLLRFAERGLSEILTPLAESFALNWTWRALPWSFAAGAVACGILLGSAAALVATRTFLKKDPYRE
jgi:cell division transport system permease protein